MPHHLLPVDFSEGDVDARGGERRAFHVAALIVEEDVRLQHLQHGPLREAAQEKASLTLRPHWRIELIARS